MSIGYHLSHAGQLIRRRFTRGIQIIFVTAVVTVGVGLAISGYYGNVADLSALSEQVVVSVFLKMDADSLDVLYVREQILQMAEITDVEVIYPEEARADFERMYGTPTETLLSDNPFPITLTALLHEEYRTPSGVQSTVNKCKRISQVEDARFRSTFVTALQQRWRQTFSIWLAGGCIIAVVFFVLLAISIKHSSGLTREEAEILNLTGARRMFIATPHILYSIFFIVLGVAAGCGLTLGIHRWARKSLPVLDVAPDVLPWSAGATLATTLFIALYAAFTTAKPRERA